MKYQTEYRDPKLLQALAEKISQTASQPWTLMEVCGGQTHAIVRYALDSLLPGELELLHGPGCPVCVTPTELIDQAIALSHEKNVTLCTFGDMARVPGTETDLLGARAAGGSVKLLYSPLDAVELAAKNPQQEFVFFAVGFETTAPATALAVLQAKSKGLTNFSLLSAHVLVPPALEAILGSPDNRVQGFLAAGHVCTVMGYAEYHPISTHHRVPIVVTGFEPVDILQGILLGVEALEKDDPQTINQYSRVVSEAGNPHAQEMMKEVFSVADRTWRGFGEIPKSGLEVSKNYQAFDAKLRFSITAPSATAPDSSAARCQAGEVLRGVLRPTDCPLFGRECTPESPAGAPMVSSEGACAAYYHFRHCAEESPSREPERP